MIHRCVDFCRLSAVTHSLSICPEISIWHSAAGIRGFRATGETRHVSEVSWELGRKVPLPKTEKCGFGPLSFGSGQIFSKKKCNIKLHRVTVRPELAFYWGNSPVNIRVQNPGGESFPTFPSGGYTHAGILPTI